MCFNIIPTIITMLIGLIYFFPGSILFDMLKKVMSVPLAVGIYFGIFAVILSLFLFVICKFSGAYKNIHYTLHKQILIVLVISIAAMPVLSAGLEWIYERNFSKVRSIETYVFLIDNSASMGSTDSSLGNDPDNMRYGVVANIINSFDQNKKIGIYTFGNETHLAAEIGSVQPGSVTPSSSWEIGEGSTNIAAALDTIINDIKANSIAGPISIITLTDGSPSDISGSRQEKEFVLKCNENDISFSTVAFGDYDRVLFERIADKTGGAFVPADNVDVLQNSVAQAIMKQSMNRDLISVRADRTNNNIIYIIMRVLFLILIGALLTYSKYINVSVSSDGTKFLIVCMASIVLGSILVEVLCQIWFLETIARLLMCVLFALCPVPYGNSSNVGSNIRQKGEFY